MKTRIVSLLIIMGMFTHFTFAQNTDFSLKDYKYPDLKRSTFTGDFFLNNNLDFNTAETIEDFELKSKSNFQFSAGVDYNRRINTRKWQSNTFVNVGNSFSFNKNKTKVDTAIIANRNSHNLRIASDNRRYFEKNYFVELNPQMRGIFSRVNNEGSGLKRLTKNSLVQANVELGIGKGRLEFVSDVHQAMFTLEDLEKAGLLQRTADAEDIKLISDKISELKNERFFDARHKVIYQFTQLDSLLQSRGLLAQGDAASTVVLYDNWLYGFRPFRFAGQRFSIGGVEDYTWSKSSEEIDEPIVDAKTQRLNLGAYAEYRYEKPINLYWQHSFTARAEWRQQTAKDLLLNTEATALQSGLALLEYTLSFYPNTRTQLSCSGLIATSANQKANGMDWEAANYVAGLFFNADYYISPQFRLDASYDFGYANRSTNVSSFFPQTFGNAFDTGLFSRFNFGLDYFFW